VNPIDCVPLSPDRIAGYLAFVETRAFTDNPRGSGCYCCFPIHGPRKIEWRTPSSSENRASINQCIGSGRTAGFLAYRDGEVIGWCNAGPWSMYPMLHDEPQPDSDRLGVVFCFVVAPQARDQGVARSLLAAPCEGLRAHGMNAVQAKPLKGAKSAAENHLGPLSMYVEAGFELVRETEDGDVFVRKSLA
jgi:ribosomal protein S18 acetylase RimI-like enzyme